MKRTALILLSTILLAVAASPADDFWQWRGPDRDGKSPERGLLKSWPEGGPKLLWKADIGDGYSSVTTSGDKVYTSGVEDGKGYVYAFSNQGEMLWKTSYGKGWQARSYGGSRTTPTVYDDKVYVVSAHGNVLCANARTGQTIWTVDLQEEYGAQVTKWGISEAPLIVGEKLIVTPGGTKSSMVALNRNTGKEIWKSPVVKADGKAQKSGYCSAKLIEQGDRSIIVTHLESAAAGFDAEKGSLLWQVPFVNRWRVYANTPVRHEDMIVLAAGYGYGAVGLEMSDDGGKVSKEWASKDMATFHGGMVEIDGYVYGTSTSREVRRGFLACINAKSGETAWTSKEIEVGSILYADGLMYYFEDRGTVGIAKVSPKGCEVVSTFRVGRRQGPLWAHPAIGGGVLYVRHGNELMAYDIRGENYKAKNAEEDGEEDESASSDGSQKQDKPLDNATVAKRLDVLIRNLECRGTSLKSVLVWLEQMTDVPVQPDWEALADADVKPDTEITLKLSNLSAENMLKLILSAAGRQVDYQIKDGKVVVSTRKALAKN